MTHTRLFTRHTLLAAALLAAAPLAQAANCTWQAAGTGAWASAGNWDCGHAPTAADTANVEQNTDVVTLGAGDAAAAQTLMVYAGLLDVSSGAQLSTTDSYGVVWIGSDWGPAPTPSAELRVRGAGSKWQAQWANVVVGNGAPGAVIISDGGEVAISGLSFYLGANGSTGTLAIGALPSRPPAAPGTVSSATDTPIHLGYDAASLGQLVFNHTDVSGGYQFTRGLLGPHGELLHQAGVTRLVPSNAVAGHYFTGSVRVTGGTLELNPGPFVARAGSGNHIAGGITVESGGTLAGQSTLGDAIGHFPTPITVQAGGTLAPGALGGYTGVLTVAEGGVTAQAGATLRFGLDNAAGSQLAVAGTIDLGGATLALTLAPGYTHTVGQQWTLVDNTGTGAVQGRFAQGTSLMVGGHAFGINYAAGDGNDVVLTALAALPPEGGGGGGNVAAVPTLGEWSLAVLGLLAAGLGAAGVRKRCELPQKQ